MNWDDIITDATATDTGMRRSNNQDNHTVVRAPTIETWRQRGHLFMVADGMGAHAVGELASKMACDNIPHNYHKTRTGTSIEAITKAYREVGALIHSRASANVDFQGMGTTCSTLLLLPEGALIAHVGDSRVYRIRNGRIDQLSFDHSLAWELVRRNHLTLEHANLAVPKNVITRSLGPDPNVEVDTEGPLAVEPSDVYLLCSDGLTGPVADPELGAFAGNFHPKDACRYLINLSNLRGGLDNITVLILRIGLWIEPNSAGDVPTTPHDKDKGKKKWHSSLADLFHLRPRSTTPAIVEDHPYRSADCPINPELVERFSDLTRRIQTYAIDHAWSLDWNQFAQYRRQETEARAAGNQRAALRSLGEMMVLLGVAARFHRKASSHVV